MRNISSLILFICSLPFFSCSEEIKEIKPNEIIEINGKPLDIISIGFPTISMLNDGLLVFNSKDDNVFKLYNTDSFELELKFGIIGDGPSELRRPSWIADNFDQLVTNKTLSIYELEQNRLTNFQILSDTSENRVNITETQLYQKTSDRVNEIIINTDSTLIYSPNSIGRLVILNKRTGGEKITPYELTTSVSNIKESNLGFLFLGRFAVNPDREIIVSSLSLFGQLDFFDFNGKLIRSVIYDNHNHYSNELRLENLTSTRLLRYSMDIEVTKDAIYLMVQDIPLSRIGDLNQKCRVLKFNWDGEFLKEYRLDNYATSIAVDEVKSKLYVCNQLNEQTTFWLYPLD